MAVAVVQVWVMRMRVRNALMAMPVRVRFGHSPFMAMAVMGVMDVGVVVFQRLVRVFVVMAFGKMQPDAGRHKCAGGQHTRR